MICLILLVFRFTHDATVFTTLDTSVINPNDFLQGYDSMWHRLPYPPTQMDGKPLRCQQRLIQHPGREAGSSRPFLAEQNDITREVTVDISTEMTDADDLKAMLQNPSLSFSYLDITVVYMFWMAIKCFWLELKIYFTNDVDHSQFHSDGNDNWVLIDCWAPFLQIWVLFKSECWIFDINGTHFDWDCEKYIVIRSVLH